MSNTQSKRQKNGQSAPKTVKKVIRRETFVPEQSIELRAEEPQVRYLKVQPVYRRLVDRVCIVPELRLNGRWLEQAGFGSASYASITVMEGLLIIRSGRE